MKLFIHPVFRSLSWKVDLFSFFILKYFTLQKYIQSSSSSDRCPVSPTNHNRYKYLSTLASDFKNKNSQVKIEASVYFIPSLEVTTALNFIHVFIALVFVDLCLGSLWRRLFYIFKFYTNGILQCVFFPCLLYPPTQFSASEQSCSDT